MALFLVANNLTPEDIARPGAASWPSPRVGGRALRRPARPAARAASRRSSRSDPQGPPADHRPPGANLPPADLDQARERLGRLLGREPTSRDALSYLLYPQVFPDFAAHERTYSDTSVLPTPVFFYGPDIGEENPVEIEPGKTLIVKLPGRRRAARRRQAAPSSSSSTASRAR